MPEKPATASDEDQSRRVAVRPTAASEVLRAVWNHPANSDNKLSAIARTLRFQVTARATGKPTIVPLGKKSSVYAKHDGAGSKRAAYAPIPDWEEMQVWIQRLQRGDLFIDVGANVGLYSVLMAELGCEVISIEPIQKTAEQLKDNMFLNGYEAEILQCAVADEPGSMTMAGPDALRQHLVSSDTPEGMEVPVRTLDEITGSRNVAGLKIDVEGAERMVLAGGSSAIAEGRIGLMQLEWNDTAELNFGETRAPVVEFLSSHGYNLYRPDKGGHLQRLEIPDLGPDVFARRD